MYRTTVSLSLLLIVAACLLTAGDAPAVPSATSTSILRVTSAKPGTEYAFEGAYMMRSGQGEFKVLKAETPFEVEIPSGVAAAILRVTSPSGQLMVRMVGRQGEKQTSVSTGTGQSFVVENGVTPKGGSIKVF